MAVAKVFKEAVGPQPGLNTPSLGRREKGVPGKGNSMKMDCMGVAGRLA